MSIPVLSPIPQPPATTDPENFNTRADAFLAALPRLQQELNTAVAALNPLVPDLPGLTSIANNLESIHVAEANIAHVQATSANIASVVAVAGNSARIHAVANNEANINTVAANSTSVAVAAENIADILAAPSAATAAAMSARTAEAAQTGAEAAKAGAEAAQAGAETAKAGAETAQTRADAAKAGAEKARDEAVGIVGGNYVTVDTEQTVTGKKTFTGGIVGDVEGNAATATLAASVPWDGVTDKPEVAVVISLPVITGYTHAPIGHAVPFTVLAVSGIQNGAIVSFRYRLGSEAEQTVSASNSTATFDVTIPAGTAVDTVLVLTVTAVDNYGNTRGTSMEVTAVAAVVNAPAVIAPKAGAFVSAVNIPMTGAGFSVVGAEDTQKARRARACTPEGVVLFTGPWVTGSAVTSLTLVPSPALSPAASIVLQLQDEATALGESPWSPPVAVTVASVVQPTITSPVADAEVAARNITIVSSAMALTGDVVDELTESAFTIYDTAGNVVVSANSGDKTSCVFQDLPVSPDTYYSLGVAQQSKYHGASVESVRRRIKTKASRHGEILYDAGGPAAVIVGSYASNGKRPWLIRGKPVWIAVCFARLRTNAPWCATLGETNLQNIPNIENPLNEWKLAADNNSVDSNGSYVSIQSTEAHMDGSLIYYNPVKDSKALTTAILAYNQSYQASRVARSRDLRDFGPMDLPRIDVLMRIYQARYMIDAMDPTVNTYPGSALSRWKIGPMDAMWSSSQFNNGSAWCLESNGHVSYTEKTNAPGVISVLEIPA